MIMKVLLLAAVLVSLPTPLAAGDSLSLDQSLDQSLDHDALMALARKQWRNKSTQVIASVLQEAEAGAAAHRRRLLAYSKLGKVSTLSFVHIARTGGLSFNKLLVENRGVVGRDGNRIPDCIVPRAAYGNASLPLASRFDFPHCEILSAIWPLPTVQVIPSFLTYRTTPLCSLLNIHMLFIPFEGLSFNRSNNCACLKVLQSFFSLKI
jgi:hypothetical protein